MDDLLQQSLKYAEDLCEYKLYSFSSDQDLEKLRIEILAWTTSICGDYIWHKDPFNLVVDVSGVFLSGKLRFGDCLHDEWFVTWLLEQISAKWPVAAQIEDNDGQFLLIEAADELPKWITPANADNRIWFAHGKLHLVPIEESKGKETAMETDEPEEEDAITALEAVKIIAASSKSTEAPSGIQRIIRDKLAGFPDSNKTSHLHTTLAYLPKEVAVILQQQPTLISPIVDIFYLRDQIQLRACQTMSRFPPTNPADTDTIQPVQVKMTRPLYAQLLAQRFYPPKPFERARWFANTEEGSEIWRRRDIGLKIMCGCEMLYNETKAKVRTTKVQLDSAPAVSSSATRSFIDRLEKLGYFQNEKEGSAKYTLLKQRALQQFSEQQDSEPASNFATIVEENKSADFQPSDQTEDSDSWMDLDQDQLEALLESRTTKGGGDEDEAMEMAEAGKMNSMVGKLQTFLQGQGDLDGAMFEDELSSDEDDSEQEKQTQSSRTTKENVVPALPANEWGQSSQPPVANKPSSSKDPKLEPEKYDGVSDDSDEDEGDQELDVNEDGATVVEEEVDMQQEMNDFLKFTREALGLSESQYEDILSDRKGKGSYVPPSVGVKDIPDVDLQSTLPEKQQTPARNPKLDSFEALMDAMDTELHRQKAPSKSADKGKPKNSFTVVDEEQEQDPDMDKELEAELNRLLARDPDDMEEDGQPSELNLLKNMLASFDSQQGLAGPVSNLFGRLDPSAKLPRNSDN